MVGVARRSGARVAVEGEAGVVVAGRATVATLTSAVAA